MENIELVFERFDNEYLKFDLVENKKSSRPDLHAFLLLDSLMPSSCDMVAAAEHDEIFLDVELDDLEKTAITEDQICELVRCGVRVSDYGLSMFV